MPGPTGSEPAYSANNTSFWEQRFIEGGAMLEKHFDGDRIGENNTVSLIQLVKILDPIGMPNICTFRALENTETGNIARTTNENGPVLGGNVAWPMLSTSVGLEQQRILEQIQVYMRLGLIKQQILHLRQQQEQIELLLQGQFKILS